MTDWLPDLGGGKAIKEIRKQVEKLEQIVRQHKQRISDNTSNIEYNVEIAAKEVDRFEEEHKRDMLKIEELASFPWLSENPDLGSHFCQSKKFSNVLVVESNTAV